MEMKQRLNIRKAVFDDIDAVSGIYEHIHISTEQGAIPSGWIRGIYPTKKTAEDAVTRQDLFVAEFERAVIGAAIFNQIQLPAYRNAPWQNKVLDDNLMVVHTLVIDPQMKGQGFGKEFMSFYEKYAKNKGCKVLRLDTNEKNFVAREFYKKLGFTEIAIVSCEFNNLGNVNLVLLEKNVE